MLSFAISLEANHDLVHARVRLRGLVVLVQYSDHRDQSYLIFSPRPTIQAVAVSSLTRAQTHTLPGSLHSDTLRSTVQYCIDLPRFGLAGSGFRYHRLMAVGCSIVDNVERSGAPECPAGPSPDATALASCSLSLLVVSSPLTSRRVKLANRACASALLLRFSLCLYSLPYKWNNELHG